MKQNLIPLFLFLEKENITIDKTEFEFQIQSHPAYPSLLSIADTLSFFNIKNLATRIAKEQIDDMPTLFIAYLNEELNTPSLFLVEKKGESYLIFKDKNTISRQELEQRWLGIVLVVEKPEFESAKIKNNNFNGLFLSLLILAFGGVLYSLNAKAKEILFLLFPTIGILFSIAALKDLFGTKSELINSFCNLTAATSCNTIVDSKKWKVFEFISFSDLSIVFFGFQFFGLLTFMVSGNASVFLAVQKVLLFGAIPVIVASLYFQKFVEKKWCPICLAINAIILAELTYLFFTIPFDFTIITPNAIVLLSFVFTTVAFFWITLKKILVTQKELEETQLKNNRFIRNYKVFKNNLLAESKKDLPNSPIVLGNKQSPTQITVVSNPFCGHCKNAHEILEKVLERQTENLQIKVIFKTDLKDQSEESAQLFRNLYYLGNQNIDLFSTALKEWFDKKNIKEWLNKYELDKSNTWDDEINAHNNWCELNGVGFTPSIFINGYAYPQLYEREHLEHFINDLIEDHELQDVHDDEL